jgi:hypothetical protein
MRSAVGNGLCRFVIGISYRTMLGCGPQMCSDIADLIRRGSVVQVFPSARDGGYLTLAQARYTFQKATAAVDGQRGSVA